MRILVACGGTAGHFLPALSFIQALKEKDQTAQVGIVLTKRKLESQIYLKGIKVYRISLLPISKKLNYGNLLALARLVWGSCESLWIIFSFRPDIVIGFGGYASFPLILFSAFLGKKTVIHEQNVLLGLSNRILSFFVNRIALGFEQAQDDLRHCKYKVVVTGNPVRSGLQRLDKVKAREFFGLDAEAFTILVTGGSQGSHKINTEFVQALTLMKPEKLLQVIHLSGSDDYASLVGKYKEIGVKARVFSFLKEMQYAYSAADMAICRAGAGTVAELVYYRLSALIVPYPHASGHQMENAKVLHKAGGCIIIEDKVFDARNLKDLLADFLRNPQTLEAFRLKLDNFLKPQAAESLAGLVLGLRYGK